MNTLSLLMFYKHAVFFYSEVYLNAGIKYNVYVVLLMQQNWLVSTEVIRSPFRKILIYKFEFIPKNSIGIVLKKYYTHP